MSARPLALASALLLASAPACAQWRESLEVPLAAYEVLAHQERAMEILLAWGGLSVGARAVMVFETSPVVRGFGIQNLAWGAINGGIALWAHSSIEQMRRTGFSAQEERAGFRRILLVITLLDILYVAVGAGLMLSEKESPRGTASG